MMSRNVPLVCPDDSSDKKGNIFESFLVNVYLWHLYPMFSPRNSRWCLCGSLLSIYIHTTTLIISYVGCPDILVETAVAGTQKQLQGARLKKHVLAGGLSLV